MGSYDHLLVGLEISHVDRSTARYAGMISHMGPAQTVTFLHASTALDVAETAQVRYPELTEPLSPFIVDHIKDVLAHHFHGHPETRVEWTVRQGIPLVELLRWARQEAVDLLVVGKKPRSVLPGKLARKAPCSVLVVPDGAPAQITRILVPVDFSEDAANAMREALALARAYGAAEVVCQHVTETPHRRGQVPDGAAADARQQGERALEAFLEGFDLTDVAVTRVVTADTSPARAIEANVETQHVDLIVMGTRGRTVATALLLGSVTERLLWTTPVPLLAVKRKGARLHLLDALLRA